MQIEQLYQLYLQSLSVQTDTRQLKKGDIFFALKGDNFNGNQFAKQALDSGASYAVIDEAGYEIPGKTILTENVLITLQQLAAYHRAQLNIPFIAITGSNGKTTTKELIHVVLSKKYRTSTTVGNLNNHIGIPLTILRVPLDTEIAVIEMGANHQQEIAGYCVYTNPTHGLITNVGKAHLEGFGGEEGVRKGKGELFDHLRQLTHGFAFVNWDYEYLQEMSKGISGIIKYGEQDGAHVVGKASRVDPFLEVSFTEGFGIPIIKTQLVGSYNVPNVLAAVTIGKNFNVPENDIRDAIEHYVPSNSRSQLIRKGTNTIILDAYNANPSSMSLAIENFARMEGEKILLLGAMAELGTGSVSEHEQIIALIKKYTWKQVVLVGGDFGKINHPFLQFTNSTEAAEWLKKQDFQGSAMLIKGSRSSKMEVLLKALEQQ